MSFNLNRDSFAVGDLLKVMARLRDPVHGCPWDCQQTYETIIPFTLEEAYEVLDAIERKDRKELCEELGDLLFQIIFLSRIAEEEGAFNFNTVAQTLHDKLVRRHPHVFGNVQYADEAELVAAWDSHKASERAAKHGAEGSASHIGGVARALPALVRAQKLQSRAAKVGFDWPDVTGALTKLNEEVHELMQELGPEPDSARIAEELGDVIFTCVNIARHLHVDPEGALRSANSRFEQRFRTMERVNALTGLALGELSTEQWERLWDEAKRATAHCANRDNTAL